MTGSSWTDWPLQYREPRPHSDDFLSLQMSPDIGTVQLLCKRRKTRQLVVLDTVVANQVQDEPVMTISQLPPMSSEDSPTKTGGETSPGREGDSGAPETKSMDSMPRGYEAFHLRSLTTVAPGQSIYFSLPLNHIGPTWHAEIPFYFSKEAIPFYIGTNGKSRIRGASNHVSLYEEDVRATGSASGRGGSSAPQ